MNTKKLIKVTANIQTSKELTKKLNESKYFSTEAFIETAESMN